MARILVIDDNEDLRIVIKTALEAEGFEVRAAADGKQGLALQRAQGAELIITDVFMPEQDGIETIRALKKEFPDVKIIAMSGGVAHLQANYLKMAEMLGASTTLEKPFDGGKLVEAVRAVLDAAPPLEHRR